MSEIVQATETFLVERTRIRREGCRDLRVDAYRAKDGSEGFVVLSKAWAEEQEIGPRETVRLAVTDDVLPELLEVLEEIAEGET